MSVTLMKHHIQFLGKFWSKSIKEGKFIGHTSTKIITKRKFETWEIFNSALYEKHFLLISNTALQYTVLQQCCVWLVPKQFAHFSEIVTCTRSAVHQLHCPVNENIQQPLLASKERSVQHSQKLATLTVEVWSKFRVQ